MTRILLYEFVTGGGCYSLAGPAPDSLLAEGRAMLGALAQDFALAGHSLDVLIDVHQPKLALPPSVRLRAVESARAEQQLLAELASQADWTSIVAPEFDGHLLARCERVIKAGGRLLGPSQEFVALASDKHALALHLAARGVPMPTGVALEPGDRLPREARYPAVLKPRDGAGSLGVRLVNSPGDIDRVTAPSRLEEFCPGLPVSVALLCGPHGARPLAPCRQRLDGFSYLGGELPLSTELARRASRLAARAVSLVEPTLGYIGVDLVLGDELSGARDVVIEINPRVTTSYVGLRALAKFNLAAAMLAVAQGHEPELCWHPG
ncbi:MAG TPA: ATP-grasp domain-containing protein, partial [Pirellulales bacterium]